MFFFCFILFVLSFVVIVGATAADDAVAVASIHHIKQTEPRQCRFGFSVLCVCVFDMQ